MTKRTPVIVGNWKMHMPVSDAIQLSRALKNKLIGLANVEVGVCPPYLSIPAVREALKETDIGVGAQNMHWEEKGAFTGEVSADMLVEAGCRYVILGHSERRQLFGEKNAFVLKKASVAIQKGLTPIVCVGETLEEREAGKMEDVIAEQVEGSVGNLPREHMAKTIIAYEPVWAIGTGKTATPDQANSAHMFIRDKLTSIFDGDLARSIRIQYGGSVKPDNASELLGQSDIDGALVGGASLKADDFSAIVKAAR